MAKKKIFDKDSWKTCSTGEPVDLELTEDRLAQGKTVRELRRTPRQAIIVQYAKDAKVIKTGGAEMVLGRRSPVSTGIGAIAVESNTIDLVVGRVASSNGGKGPSDGMLVTDSFSTDAARIYISQMMTIDNEFGIVRPGNEKSRTEHTLSGIAIKADQVRVIGRAGVKIITGGAHGLRGAPVNRGGNNRSEPNSRGGTTQYHPRIDLLAGNYDGRPVKARHPKWEFGMPKDRISFVQPMVKGENMARALNALADILHSCLSAIFNETTSTTSTMSAMAADPLISPAASAACATAAAAKLNFVCSPSYRYRAEIEAWRAYYATEDGDRYICSRHIRGT